MSKTKLLTWASIGLLVLNILLIWNILSHKPPKMGGDGPKNIIIEKLHLDEEQKLKYEALISKHKLALESSQEEIKSLKNKLYASLQFEAVGNTSDSIINQISDVQKRIEKIHYSHFSDVKALCRPDQQKDFDALSLEIARLFNPRPNK